jgi:TRAP-type C4-dicarboxylate transport system substrate-binding protein
MPAIRTRLAIAALATSLAAGAAAQQVEWRFNNNYAPTRPESAHIRAFAADVAARTNGRMTISVSEGGAMGLKDADALRYMQAGTPEMSFIWSPFLGRDAPDIANIYVFGLVSTAKEHLAALPAVKEVLTEGIEKRGVAVIGFMGLPIIDASLFCRDSVTSLDALRRVKLRVGSREQVETFAALGVSAQIVPQNELYAALQTGVVDCALYAARFAKSVSLQEVAKHATPVGFPFPPTPYAMLANRAKWAALDAELKAKIGEALSALEAASFQFDSDAEAETAARAALTADGVTWHPPLPEADKAAVRAAAVKTWATLATEAGGDAAAYRERILKLLPQ